MSESNEALTMSRSRRLRGSKGRFVPLQRPAREAQGAVTLPELGPGTERGSIKSRLKPSQCRVYLRKELANSFRGIVSGFVKQAESGSVPHMKETMLLLGDPSGPKKRKASGQQLRDALERLDHETEGAAQNAPNAPDLADVWRD